MLSALQLAKLRLRESGYKSTKEVVHEVKESEISQLQELETCPFCMVLKRAIDASLETPIFASLGSLGQLQKSRCSKHSEILPSLDHSLEQEVTVSKPRNQWQINIFPELAHDEPKQAIRGSWEGLNISSSTRHFNAAPTPTPRLINHSWIDLDLCRKWLDECRATHHDTCSRQAARPLFSDRPSLLLDTKLECLVRAEEDQEYFALSYVWGGLDFFMTRELNFQDLLKHSSLRNLAYLELLPTTIRQAISLTSALGGRYLWVDALCIIQDSKDKARELEVMASIFANAVLTIVAAQGVHADSGFQGLLNISSPRQAKQHMISIGDSHKLFRPSSRQVWDDSLLSPWSHRAWTFQESICSRRMLVFAHDSVRWKCQKAWWSEESHSSDCLKSHATPQQRNITSETPRVTSSIIPSLTELELLVNSFNARKLTFPEDALMAFTGVCTILSSKFPGGFVSGLPELFFDLCLLWRPLRYKGLVQRRKALDLAMNDMLPSWSWAGWMTEVAWPYTWNATNDITSAYPALQKNHRPFFQTPFEYTCNELRQEWQPLHNIWSTFAPSKAIPSRRKSDREIIGAAKVQSSINDLSPKLLFAIPPCEVIEPPRYAKFIRFKTTRGIFATGQTRRSMTRIHTLDGKPAGTLWQHDEEDKDYLSAAQGQSTVELIAIFGNSIPVDEFLVWKDAAGNVDTSVGPGMVREIYNVMWIVWLDNIAYRKATGEINRKIWESYAQEHIEVTLG